MRTFGLTGGIGTGKSTVATLLREQGIAVIDADVVAREVVEPGSDGLAEIVQTFGAEVLTADGRLDRVAMRRRIAAEPEVKRSLEQITHPRIAAVIEGRLRALAAEGHAVAGVEAALMVETGSWRRYDVLVVVTCDADRQVARVMARDGVDEEAARAIIRAQWPMERKVALATHVITNDGDPAALRAEVARLAEVLRRG